MDEKTAQDAVPSARDSFGALAGRLSRILGACELDTLDAAVEECLEELGRYSDVDVAFVVLTDDDERIADDWRWVGVDRVLVPPAPGSPLRDSFGSVTEILRLGHTVAVDDLAEIELAPSERALVDVNCLRAILMAPVRVGTTLLGVTGLQVLDHPHHWDRRAVENVELVAELIVKAAIRTRDRGALAAADARARRIAEFLPDGLLLLDPAGSVTFASTSFARGAGVTAAELVGTALTDLVHADDRNHVRTTMAATDTGSGLSARVRTEAGWRWSSLSWQLVHEPESRVADEIVVSVRDVHDERIEAQHLARERERDPLTGLLDRRGLDAAIADLSAQRASISIGFVDIDQFKVVNDSLGHDAGDEVLRAVAVALAGAVRRTDVVARIGGDEFCVVARAEDDGPDGPTVLGQRLCDAVRAGLGGRVDPVTVSIGIAGPGRADRADELRSGADAAMYRAKRAGGGHVEVADPPST